MKWAKGEPLTEADVIAMRKCKPQPDANSNETAVEILAAEAERLRCELGHAQEQIQRIKALCMGSGVGLREDVWDVVGRA